MSHPHVPYFPHTELDIVINIKSKKKAKDAFYGNINSKEERYAVDMARQARLATKSGDGFMANLRLAIQDITSRVSRK